MSILFALTLVSVVTTRSVTVSYWMSTQVKDKFEDEFNEIVSEQSFWNFMKTRIAVVLFEGDSNNEEALEFKKHIEIVGLMQMRQLRTVETDCKRSVEDTTCYANRYSKDTRETEDINANY